jgi:hypothetical protein
VAHDTGRRIEPTAGADELSAAVEEFQKVKRSDLTGMGRRAGALVSAKVRTDDAKARVELIWEDWFKREVPTSELLLRAGLKRKGRRDVIPMAYQTAEADRLQASGGAKEARRGCVCASSDGKEALARKGSGESAGRTGWMKSWRRANERAQHQADESAYALTAQPGSAILFRS